MEANEIEPIDSTGGEIPPETPAEDIETSGTLEAEGEDTAAEPEVPEVLADETDVTDTPKPKKDRVQERIDELTRQRHEKEREASYWKGRAESGTPKQETTPAQVPQDPSAPFSVPRPQEDDYDTFAEYEASKDDWLVARAKHEARQEIFRETARTRADTDVRAWIQGAPATIPDFEEVVCRPYEEGGAPISQEMVEICRNSPVGHQLLYQLAENHKEVSRLRAMPPHLMAMEIARREAKLSVSPAQPKKVTGAPSPIQPVIPAVTSMSKPLEDLPTEEFIKRRNQEEFGPNWKGR